MPKLIIQEYRQVNGKIKHIHKKSLLNSAGAACPGAHCPFAGEGEEALSAGALQEIALS